MVTNERYLNFKSIILNKQDFFKELCFEIRLEVIVVNGEKRYVPSILYNWSFFEAKCNNKLFISFFSTCLEYANQTIINDCLRQELTDVELLKDIWYDTFIICVKEEGVTA